MDGTDINACYASRKKGLVVSVDDFGRLNLFKYPCNSFSAEKKVYTGHSSHVTNVTMVANETSVISTGGNDTAVFQWSVMMEDSGFNE